MLYRTLQLILPTGESFDIRLPDFNGWSEIESTQEFIGVIKKYSKALNGIRSRKSELVKGKTKRFETLDQQIHSLVNARKYVDADYAVPSLLVTQLFKLNLQDGTFTVFSFPAATGGEINERGTMYLSSIFDNWKDIFFPEYFPVIKAEVFESVKETESDDDFFKLDDEKTEHSFEDEDDDEEFDDEEHEEDEEETSSIIPTSHREKMEELLCDREGESAYNLWHYLFIERGLADKQVVIRYSGGGDSGCTDEVSVYDKTAYKKASSFAEVTDAEIEMDPPLARDEELDRLIWEVISTKEAGFYNNEGGYGEMLLSSTSFVWNHYNYIQETEHTVGTNVEFEEETKTELPF
jgi:hypothetical protein